MARGAKEEDLFGCLYFYLSEQLSKFKEQLGKLNVTLYLSNTDSQCLSSGIRSGGPLTNGIGSLLYPAGLPTTFDRIAVSNFVEKKSLGYDHVLSNWGPLLNTSNPSATILSYSKHWQFDHPFKQNEKKSAQNMREFMRERVCSICSQTSGQILIIHRVYFSLG
jgi:hypothetical protein